MIVAVILIAATIGIILVILSTLDNPISEGRGAAQVAQPRPPPRQGPHAERAKRLAALTARAISEPPPDEAGEVSRIKAGVRLLMWLGLAALSGAAFIVLLMRWMSRLLERLFS